MIKRLTTFLLLSLSPGFAAEFVDITAQFTATNRVQYGGGLCDTQTWNHLVHCVVGTNLWLIEGNFASNADSTHLFTGTNLIQVSVMHEAPGLHLGFPPLYAYTDRLLIPTNKAVIEGKRLTNTWSSDGFGVGNAGQANLAWLAFCSGPYLKQTNRVIPWPDANGYFPDPPSSDRRQVFSDELGLPSSVEFFSCRRFATGHTISHWPSGQYKVVESTNFLGWTFPLRFEVTQSTGPGGGDGTGLYDGAELVVVGHVISILQSRRAQSRAFRSSVVITLIIISVRSANS